MMPRALVLVARGGSRCRGVIGVVATVHDSRQDAALLWWLGRLWVVDVDVLEAILFLSLWYPERSVVGVGGSWRRR
jgi:hypothetical protein